MRTFTLNKDLLRIRLVLVLISLFLTITINPIAQSEEKVFRIAANAGLDNLDPRVLLSLQHAVIQSAIFEPLVRIRDGNVFPGLAESWEISDDGITYTFHLRDAKWSDGKPITAGDFVHAFVRMFEICPASQNVDDIKNGAKLRAGEVSPDELGAKAIDDKTLVISLENPAPYFMGVMDYYSYPGREDLVEKYGDGYGATAESLTSCGPFTLTEWKQEDKLVMVKNPDYWNKDEIKLDKIIVYVIPEEKTRRNMFDNGEIDYYEPTSGTEILEYEGKGLLLRYDKAIVRYIALNRHGHNDPIKGKILSNPNFMKAISCALDRKGFVENVLKGNGSPATVQVPAGIAIYPGKTWGEVSMNIGKYHQETPDLTKSKEYMDNVLEDMGYTSVDQFPTFDFLTSQGVDDPTTRPAYLMSIFRELGLKVNVTQATGNQFWNSLYKPALAYDFVISGWGAAYDDPKTFMWYWNSGSMDMGVTFENPEYDALMDQANQETDLVKRAEILNEAEALFADIAPCIPFMYDRGAVAVQPWVKGLTTSISGQYIKHVYCDIDK